MTTTEAAPTHLRENPYAIVRQQLRLVGETFGIDPNLINGHTADISIVQVADAAVRKLVTKDGPDSGPVWSP